MRILNHHASEKSSIVIVHVVNQSLAPLLKLKSTKLTNSNSLIKELLHFPVKMSSIVSCSNSESLHLKKWINGDNDEHSNIYRKNLFQFHSKDHPIKKNLLLEKNRDLRTFISHCRRFFSFHSCWNKKGLLFFFLTWT